MGFKLKASKQAAAGYAALLEQLTSHETDGICPNMKAKLVLRERQIVTEDSFAELLIWHVPKPVAGSRHGFKYALAYVVQDLCVLRYDNEAGKGDHRHIATDEMPYHFRTVEKLLADFWRDVDEWKLK